jgi:hypothetical protein
VAALHLPGFTNGSLACLVLQGLVLNDLAEPALSAGFIANPVTRYAFNTTPAYQPYPPPAYD